MKWTKRKIVLLAFTLVLLLSLFFGWNYIRTSPQYSIYQMYKSVRNHDYESFKKYVDVEDVAEALLDQATSEVSKESEEQGSDWAEWGEQMAEALIMQMKPAFKEKIEKEIKKAVEEGVFGEDYKPKNVVKSFQIAKVEKEGKLAVVTIKNEKGEELKLKMRKMNGYWQIFNMNFELEEFTSKESTETEEMQQAKYGEKADIGMGWFLTVGEPEVYEVKDIWDEPKEGYKVVSAEVVYENTSQKRDSFSLSNLRLKDTEDHSYSDHLWGGKGPKLESGELEPGGKVKGFVSFEILEEAEVQSVIYTGAYKTIVFNK